MLGNIVENKVRVFLSSRCDENTNKKYTIIRRAIKEVLVNTGFVEVYIFEDGAGSSFPVEENYLREIDRSDLCVFLIDNSEEVSEGVLKEYDRANSLNKKIMYFFCDEKVKTKTKMQEEIETKGRTKI